MLPNPVLVSDEPLSKTKFPYIVLEELINGKYAFFQIDTINDIDEKTQKLLIGGIYNYPKLDFSLLHDEELEEIKTYLKIGVEIQKDNDIIKVLKIKK